MHETRQNDALFACAGMHDPAIRPCDAVCVCVCHHWGCSDLNHGACTLAVPLIMHCLVGCTAYALLIFLQNCRAISASSKAQARSEGILFWIFCSTVVHVFPLSCIGFSFCS